MRIHSFDANHLFTLILKELDLRTIVLDNYSLFHSDESAHICKKNSQAKIRDYF